MNLYACGQYEASLGYVQTLLANPANALYKKCLSGLGMFVQNFAMVCSVVNANVGLDSKDDVSQWKPKHRKRGACLGTPSQAQKQQLYRRNGKKIISNAKTQNNKNRNNNNNNAGNGTENMVFCCCTNPRATLYRSRKHKQNAKIATGELTTI